jgi:hypothetical protein
MTAPDLLINIMYYYFNTITTNCKKDSENFKILISITFKSTKKILKYKAIAFYLWKVKICHLEPQN